MTVDFVKLRKTLIVAKKEREPRILRITRILELRYWAFVIRYSRLVYLEMGKLLPLLPKTVPYAFNLPPVEVPELSFEPQGKASRLDFSFLFS